MKYRLVTIAIGFCLCSCHETVQTETASTISIVGERVTFPDHAPQLSTITMAASSAAAERELNLGGRLAWDDDHTVRIYAPIAGKTESVSKGVNDQVVRGEVLAVIDSPDLGQAQADLAKARTDFAQADKSLARMRELLQHGAVAIKDLEAAQADQERARFERDRAALHLRTLGGKHGAVDQHYQLTSPIDGIIVDRQLAAGQQIRSDAALANIPQVSNPQFTITDPHHLWLWLDVPDSELSAIKAGQTINVISRTWPGRQFPGRIDLIAPSLDPVTRIGRVRAVVENPDLALKAEQYVSGVLQIPASTVQVEIPKRAVFLDGDRWYVFVRDADGSFVRRAVSVGAESGERMLITNGLHRDESVVVEGALLLNDLLAGAG